MSRNDHLNPAKKRPEKVQILEGWGIYLEESSLVEGNGESIYNFIKERATNFLLKDRVYELVEDKPFTTIVWKSREENAQVCRVEILDIADKACKVRLSLSFDREMSPLKGVRKISKQSQYPMKQLQRVKKKFLEVLSEAPNQQDERPLQ